MQCTEKALCLAECVKSGLVRFRAGDFSLDDAPWSSRPAEVNSDQIETLIENNQPYIYHMGDSQHTQKIQTNQALVKMKNVSFILRNKTIRTFWPRSV